MVSKELLDRVRENIRQRKKGPFCIDLVINDFCNLKCLYCSGSLDKSSKNQLSKDILIKILNSAETLSVKEISLTSLIGEPTIFKKIKFLMEAIKKRGFIGTLLTNGTLLDSEFAQFMEKISWDVLIISLDSFDPAIQYKLRPSIAHNNYLKNIIEFLGYSVKNNPNLNINFNMVVNNANYDYVEDYFRKAELYKAKNITLLKLTKMTNRFDGLALSDAQLIDFKYKLKNTVTPVDFNRLEWLSDNLASEKKTNEAKPERFFKKKCYFHLYKILINCDGQVLKCNGDPEKTGFNVYQDDLINTYNKLLETYAHLLYDPPCWDICCSPIKALNQEIAQSLGGAILNRDME